MHEVLVVEPDLAGVRLSDLLARARPHAHRIDLRQLVAGGCVSVNGETCVHDRRMRLGDVVVLSEEPPERPSTVDAPTRRAPLVVLHETATVLVVHKPPGVPTVPDRSGRDAGVHGQLAELRPGEDLRVVHRLDRDTSGCLVLARGLEAARHLDEQLRARAVHKTYVALVEGVPAADTQRIDAWLGPDKRRPGKVVASPHERPGFREAVTELCVRERFRRHALLELQPHTGRGHQLRVHLQSIGHPIVCDRDYGGAALLLSHLKSDYKLRPGVVERPLLERMFLHAERIRFRDVDGHEVDVTAPLPDDLSVALRHVEKHGRPRGADR